MTVTTLLVSSSEDPRLWQKTKVRDCGEGKRVQGVLDLLVKLIENWRFDAPCQSKVSQFDTML
jgi:hypothetical protein